MLIKRTIPHKLALLLLCLMVMAPLVIAQEDTPEPVIDPDTEATAEVTESAIELPDRPRPVPAATYEMDDITLELLFDDLPQGRVGVLHVAGEGIAGARARFRDQLSDFFEVGDDGYYGLISANIDLPARIYEFSVLVWKDDGSRITIPAQMEITLGGFIRQDFALEADRAYLADPQIERTEFARIDSIVDDVTPERPWVQDGFQVPIESELTSPFGAFRIINDTMETRHTGWDMRAPTGTPILAMGAGTVAYAGLMDIRGNHVIIDHGFGIYSGYSHMSQVHVTRGQTITRGQIIGMTGNTGRSNGPHLHWEITVNGEWVDSVDFLQMWLP